MNRVLKIVPVLVVMSFLGLGLAAIYNGGFLLIESEQERLLIDGRYSEACPVNDPV